MFTKSTLAICFALLASACADAGHAVPELNFHKLCGDWCCVYFRVVENSKSDKRGGYSSREYYFIKEDDLSFQLNPDSTCRFTMGFCPDSFAIGKVVGFDTGLREMKVANIYGSIPAGDSGYCFDEVFHWSQGADDTLLLSLDHHFADKECHFTYKLLRR